jgi:hypothetical protein
MILNLGLVGVPELISVINDKVEAEFNRLAG